RRVDAAFSDRLGSIGTARIAPFDQNWTNAWHVGGARQRIMQISRIDHLALFEDYFFAQGGSQSHHRPPDGLPFSRNAIKREADVVDGDIVDDLDVAGASLHFDHGSMRRKIVARRDIPFPRLAICLHNAVFDEGDFGRQNAILQLIAELDDFSDRYRP